MAPVFTLPRQQRFWRALVNLDSRSGSRVIEVSDRRFCPGLHETCSGGGRTWPSPGGSSAQGAVLAAARSPGTESRNQSNSICISSLHCIGYLISAPMAKLAD